MNDEMPFYILSNRQKVHGASIIFNKSLMAKIAEKLGKYYILPSSIHEVLIVPATLGRNAKELAEIVRNVNAESVPPQERLSDNIYEFDIEDETIKIA